MFSENITGTEAVFWICALLGTGFFALRIVLMILGGFGDFDVDAHDVDVGHDVDLGHDLDAHGDAHAGGDTDLAFKLLSVTSISSFIMMFGWVGLTSYKQYELGAISSTLLAMLGGAVMAFIVSYLVYFLMKLASPGASFTIGSTVGETASVYQRIPEEGRGKIQISAGGMLREIDAVSDGAGEIESFASVVVTRVIDPETVAVKKA